MVFILSKWFVVLYLSMTLMLGTILMGTFGGGATGDRVAPTVVSSVVHSTDITYYFAGRVIGFDVTFSEPMDFALAAGTRLVLDLGGNTRYAVYGFALDVDKAYYYYNVTAADHDEDGFTMSSSIDLNGGVLQDVAGNDLVDLTFTPPSMSSKRAVLRGLTWGTDFTQGADAQKLYGTVASSDTPGVASTGTRGSTSGSDSDDPSWTSAGASFDGGDHFTSVPYTGGLADYVDSTMLFSMHIRIKVTAGGVMVPWNSRDGFGSWAYVTSSWFYFVNAVNTSQTYRTAALSDPCDGNFHTISFVGNGQNTHLEVYLDGVYQGYHSSAVHCLDGLNPPGGTTADLTKVTIGDAPTGGVWSSSGTVQRFLGVCNVAHSAAEVAAVHAFLATLPNAA